MAVAPHSLLITSSYCARVLSGSVAVLVFEILKQSCEFSRSKIDSVLAPSYIATCTAHIERCRARPRVLLHALHHYVLRAKIILVDFNLSVSTLAANPQNLIPRQIFRLYGISCFLFCSKSIQVPFAAARPHYENLG